MPAFAGMSGKGCALPSPAICLEAGNHRKANDALILLVSHLN